MSLSTEVCLRSVLETLQDRIAPALADSYAGESARLAGLALGIVVGGIDDVAAIRIAENDAIRQLFRDMSPGLADAALAARLASAGAAAGSGFRLSALDRDNGALRALLVELHAAAEAREDEAGKATASRIWRMLARFEAARAPRR